MSIIDPLPVLDWHCKQDVPGLPGWLIENKPEIDGIMESLIDEDCPLS